MSDQNEKVVLGVAVDGSSVKGGLQGIADDAKSMAQKIVAAGNDAGVGIENIGVSAGKSARQTQKELRSISDQIQRAQVELATAGKSASEALLIKAQIKGIDVTGLKSQFDALRAVEAAQNGVASSSEKVGMSAAAMSAAMRNVPAQFTDIITSLQGGQRPMTVLLQQGGQLKDMFGGVGNAARAMGTYVLGMVNPLTIGAAVVGTMAVAFLEGQKESQAYRQALIETGNAAGITATRLGAMAANVAASNKVTQGSAAEALAALAGSNNIATDSFERIAAVASQLQSVTGAAVGDTVKQFAELGKSPVEASIKLNETTHFLTASIYEQIKALAEQGKTSEAAAVAQAAWATALEQRTPQLKQNLGYLETGWNAVRDAAKGAWDAMLNVGREKDPIVGANAALVAAQAALDRARGRVATGGLRGQEQDNETAHVARLEKVVAARAQEVAMLNKGAAYEAQSAAYQKQQAAQAKAQIDLDKLHDQFLGNEVRMRREIAVARETAKDAPQTPENAKRLQATIAGIREKYAGEGPRAALDAIIQGYEDQQMALAAGEQRMTKTLAAQHAAQLVDDRAFYARRRDIALEANQAQQAIVTNERDAVSRSGIKESEKLKEVARYNSEIKKLREQAITIESDYTDGLIAAAAKEQKVKDDYISSLGKAGDTESKRLSDAIARQREHNGEIGLTKEQIEAYKQSVEEAAVVQMEAQAAAIEGWIAQQKEGSDALSIYETVLKKLKEQIADRRELAGLLKDGAEREAAVAVSKAAVAVSKAAQEEWKRGWNETDRLAREVFTSWTTDGENAAKKIGDTLRKALASAIYEVTLKPVVFNVYAAITGSTGGVAGSSGGALGNVSGIKSVYDMATGGMAGVGGLVSSAGNLVGSASIASYGAGMGLSAEAATAAAAAYTEAAATVVTSNAALAATYTEVAGSLTAGSAAAGSVSSTLAAIPGWGWAALAVLAAGSMFGGYKVDDKGSTLVANLNTKGTGDVANRHDYVQTGGLFGGGTTNNSDWSKADTGITGYINSTTLSVTAATKAYAAALGLPADAVDGFTKQIEVSIAGLDPAQQKAAIDKAIGGFIDEMVASAYGGVLDGVAKSGETSSQTLQRMAVDLTTVNGGLRQLGLSVLPIGIAGAKAAAGLTDAFGGLDKMQASVGSYYEKFYSDAERAASSTASLQTQFAALGLSMPTTRDGFRQLVSSIDITTESGQRMAAAVLGLAPAFDSAASAAQAAAAKMASVIADYASSSEVRAFQVDQIQRSLADAGVVLTTDQISNASRADARALYEQLVAAGNTRGAAAVLDQAKAFAAITQPAQQALGGSTGVSAGISGSAGESAAQSIAQAWQSITDSIWEEVKRIRGLLAGTGPEAYAAAQAKFAITNAQARAGDQEAAKALPEVSRTLQDLAQQNAQSAVELRIIQGKSAAALAETANVLALKFGLSIPKFSTGTNYTQEGLAYLHEGEAVVPKAYNPAAGAPIDRSTDLVDAVRSLANRLDVIEANTRASAQFGGSISRALSKVMPDGDAIEVRTAPV